MPPPPPAAALGPPPWRKPPPSATEAASVSCQRDAGTAFISTAVVPRAILKPRVFVPAQTKYVARHIPPTEVPVFPPLPPHLCAEEAAKEEVPDSEAHGDDASEGVDSAPLWIALAELLPETEPEPTIDPKEELVSPISDDGYGLV